MMKLMVELDHGSPRMVKLEAGLHHVCPGSNQEVSQSNEVRDGTSL